MFGGASMSGRLMAPAPELSWRTRRETKFTRTLGFPTFSKAFFVNSAFKVSFLFRDERSKIAVTRLKAIEKFRKFGIRLRHARAFPTTPPACLRR
jgi:ubiquinone biosynthesis protein COQ9